MNQKKVRVPLQTAPSMANQRTQNHVYTSAQWSGGTGVAHEYSSPANGYPPASYLPSVAHNHASGSSAHMTSGYGTADAPPSSNSYQNAYYSSAAPFSPSNTVQPPSSYAPMHQAAPPLSPVSGMRHPHSAPHSHTHSHSHSQPQQFSPPQPYHQHSRTRSHSQAHYISSHAAPTVSHPPSNYPQQVPLSQAISISPQYPASPSRPFSCDLCALSFNRQHDLKRHRETHTGEKPYLCNGGCGKTFTRKDALKRHQLVKGCGKVDDAWP